MRRHRIIELVKALVPMYIYIGVTYAITFGYTIIKSIVLVVLNGTASISKLENDSYTLPSILSLVICIIIFSLMYKMGVKSGKYSSQNKSISFKKYFLIILLAVPLCLSVNIFISFTNIANYDKAFQEVQNLIYSPPLYIQIISTGLLAPICEELMFRNLIQRNIRKVFSYKATIIISAMVFAIAHGNITQGLYAFIIGIVFGIIFDKYRSVYIVAILHMALNIVSVVWTFIEEKNSLLNNIFIVIALFVITSVTSLFIIRSLMKNSKLN